jgi:hypothetical protein
MTTARATVDAAMTEAAWQTQITDYADKRGWWWRHVPDSRRVNAHWPDLELMRVVNDRGAPLPWVFINKLISNMGNDACLLRDRIQFAFIEVKRQDGKPTPGQETMIALLDLLPDVWALVARPSDWPEVERRLR